MVKLLFCVCESAILLSHFSSEAQLLNAYSFSELPGRPEKILRVTCTDISFYNGLSTYFLSDQQFFDVTETRMNSGKMKNMA